MCLPANSLPGRLLLNGRPVPVRSDEEDRVLCLLNNANVQVDGDAYLVEVTVDSIRDIISFVSSVDYPAVAETGIAVDRWSTVVE